MGGGSGTNAGGNYDRDRPPHEITGKPGKLIEPTSRKRVLELEVLAFNKSPLLETRTGCSKKVGKATALAGTYNTDHRHDLLRAR